MIITSLDIEAAPETDSYDESGFFTWEIASNTFYADGAIADLFGLDRTETEIGLPLEAYLERVHPSDRPAVALSISQSIVSGQPEQQSYRARQADGSFAYVMVFGRCFRDRHGVPLLYAGMIVPAPEGPDLAAPLLRYCLTAHDIAVKEGNRQVAAHLAAALASLGWEAMDDRIIN